MLLEWVNKIESLLPFSGSGRLGEVKKMSNILLTAFQYVDMLIRQSFTGMFYWYKSVLKYFIEGLKKLLGVNF